MTKIRKQKKTAEEFSHPVVQGSASSFKMSLPVVYF